MDFSQFNLDPRLTAAVALSGYTAPTPIQEAAIPAALNNQDLIGTAQTGTGKTAAFVLPVLQRLLLRPGSGATRVLILSPTRELAEQTHKTIIALGARTNVRSSTVYGGVRSAPQVRALKDGTDIIVACPGRLLDLIGQGYGRFNKTEVLVIDEADRMFDMGFLPSIRRILKYIAVERQTMLFSATFPHEIEQMARQILTNPKRVAIGPIQPATTVAHTLFPVSEPEKTKLLLALLSPPEVRSVLVFTRTRHRAERLTHQISRAGYRVSGLHGNLSQRQRDEALNGFKNGKYNVMVATDIAARGLDVLNITHVINYDMPDTADAYLHRIGRTGRAERSGDAYTLATPQDLAMVWNLDKILGPELPRRYADGFSSSFPALAGQAAGQGKITGSGFARKTRHAARHFEPARQPVRGFYSRAG